jgi:hypothetical protein
MNLLVLVVTQMTGLAFGLLALPAVWWARRSRSRVACRDPRLLQGDWTPAPVTGPRERATIVPPAEARLELFG